MYKNLDNMRICVCINYEIHTQSPLYTQWNRV